MMDRKMKEEFIAMLKEARGTPQEWSVIMAMVDLLEDDEAFKQMAEIHKGISDYGQFLTEKESERIVAGLVNFDGTRGPRWANPAVVWDAVERLGGSTDVMGSYNRWALYVLMNMMHSDYGGVLMNMTQGDAYARACYALAVAWAEDPDRRWSVREYFCLE